MNFLRTANIPGIVPRLLCLLSALLIFPGSLAQAQEIPDDDALRDRVLQAIASAQKALVTRQKGDGSWETGHYGGNLIGLSALATFALLESGMPANDPAVSKAVGWLKKAETDPVSTYDISLCILALAASKDPAVKGKISRLADRLESYQHRGEDSGSWGYRDEGSWYDNSNSQYAVLGLRGAADAGVPIARETWQRAQDHFLRTQEGSVENPNGAPWGYRKGQTATGSMTVAGIASLCITSEALQDDDDVDHNGRIDCCSEEDDPAQTAIDAGVRWLSRHFRIRSNPGTEHWPLYYLYGLERAGRFTGQRFFGDHDWYREGAEWLVSSQSVRDGVWVSRQEDEVAGTSLALLFLAKGLSPVLINKLKVGPRDAEGGVLSEDWNRHSRDVSHLVEYTSSIPKWPQPPTWQVVDLNTAAGGEGVAALLQSPVQYLSGSEDLRSIQGRELDLLREYLAQGGFLFAVQNCESADFDAGFRDLIHRIFDGQQQLQKLPPTHDVYRSEHVFPPDTDVPELWGVDFGCRTAIIYAPFDHGCRWNKWMRHDPPKRQINVKTQIDKSMKLGLNVIAYATGREVRHKLDRPKMIAGADLASVNRGAVQIARLRHTGGWDTAPNALRRLQSALQAANIDMAPAIPTLAASDPALFEYPMLYLHGRRNFELSPDERRQLKEYLEYGGFLFADACCGADQFDRSFRKLIEEMFGRPLERIPSDDEIYHLKLGHDIRKVKRRIPSSGLMASSLAAEETIGEPILEGIKIGDKYVVIYSKYDLSCALERQSTTACAGYPTEDAVKIGVNIVLYGLLQ